MSRLDLAARLRQLPQTVRARLQRADVFADMVRAANASVDPVRVADALVRRAAGWVQASWAVVAPDHEGHVRVMAAHDLPETLNGTALAAAGRVLRAGEDVAVANLRRSRLLDGAAGAGSLLALPLVCRGRTVGALVALDEAPSSRTPALPPVAGRAIRMLLEPGAIALDNAVRVQRAEALSVTDDLTQLYNSRYLTQVLRREAKRASRSGRPLSLLFVDLDGFKGINDAHGHLLGSRALVEAADVIKGSARETDMVSRFGGDEFALVLPDTGSEGAFAVGERLRERLAAHAFLGSLGLTVRLSASVGVATLPDVAGSAEGLLHAADQAMYWVKDHGKNGIHTAQ